MGVPTDIEIVNRATLRPIRDIAWRLGITDDELIPYGRYKAKVHIAAQAARRERPDGKLVVVSSITPTPAGEGKTTVTIGLGQALDQLKKLVVLALREPSVGPFWGDGPDRVRGCRLRTGSIPDSAGPDIWVGRHHQIGL